MKKILQKIGLNPDNSIVIGSGILEALRIRKSEDIDMVISQEKYDLLKKSGNFKIAKIRGRNILVDDKFEIWKDWYVLGKSYNLGDLTKQSTVIDGVRYVSLDFLFKVKKSWLHQKDVREKDIKDIKLIENYLHCKPSLS